jgi:hypothetical protein
MMTAQIKAQRAKDTGVTTARGALATAENTLELHRRQLAYYQQAGDTENIAKTEFLIIDDELKVENAQRALEDAQRAPVIVDLVELNPTLPSPIAGATGTLSTDTPAPAPTPHAEEILVGPYDRKVFGGVLFAVDERRVVSGLGAANDIPTVLLTPMTVGVGGEEQISIDAVTPLGPPLGLLPRSPVRVPYNATAMSLPMTFTREVYDVQAVAAEGGETIPFEFTPPNSLKLDLLELTPGVHIITVTAEVLFPNKLVDVPVEIHVTASTIGSQEPSLSPSGERTISPDAKGVATMSFKPSSVVHDVVTRAYTRNGISLPHPAVSWGVDASKEQQITVDVVDQRPGKYVLTLAFRYFNTSAHRDAEGTWVIRYSVPKRGVPTLSPSGVLAARANRDGDNKLELKASPLPRAVDFDQSALVLAGVPQPLPPLSIDADGKIVVDLFGAKEGEYVLTMPFAYVDDDGVEQHAVWTVRFRVLPPKTT